jgi:hypothetical protein
MAVGTGGLDLNWGNPLPSGVHIAFSTCPSPHSAIPHEIFEFKITFAAFPNQMQNAIGFAASAYTATQLVLWPANYSADTPTTWGELSLSSTPIPEFNLLGLILILDLILPLVIIPRVGARQQERQHETRLHDY